MAQIKSPAGISVLLAMYSDYLRISIATYVDVVIILFLRFICLLIFILVYTLAINYYCFCFCVHSCSLSI